MAFGVACWPLLVPFLVELEGIVVESCCRGSRPLRLLDTGASALVKVDTTRSLRAEAFEASGGKPSIQEQVV